ncbi:MAG: hypothetical protein ACJ72N_26445 [Labedaea sp.]
MNEAEQRSVTDRHLTLPSNGALDLGYVREHVREFLADVDENAVADAVLVVVMLTGDAYRHGIPPVTVRLCRPADRHLLRVEVDDHRREPEEPPAEDYRSVILDRITDSRGVNQRDDGTTAWAEVVLSRAT